jgi:4-hydroxy-tetrahydrodipicolinate reductase
MEHLRIGIVGAAGRMGRALVRAATAAAGCQITAGIEVPGSDAIGSDLGELAGLDHLGVSATTDPLEMVAAVDAVLDFSTPTVSTELAGLAANGRIIHVIGTTGFTDKQEQAIASAARHATIIKAGNMSLGVNLAAALTEKIASILGPDFDIEVVEMHHRHKVDAPSGTALMLGRAAADGRKVKLDDVSTMTRHGQTGERKPGTIGFATLRGGDVVGDHSVIFAGPGERIEITHKASDRSIFASGAVRAAEWGRGKGPGLFSMQDVLGL